MDWWHLWNSSSSFGPSFPSSSHGCTMSNSYNEFLSQDTHWGSTSLAESWLIGSYQYCEWLQGNRTLRIEIQNWFSDATRSNLVHDFFSSGEGDIGYLWHAVAKQLLKLLPVVVWVPNIKCWLPRHPFQKISNSNKHFASCTTQLLAKQLDKKWGSPHPWSSPFRKPWVM